MSKEREDKSQTGRKIFTKDTLKKKKGQLSKTYKELLKNSIGKQLDF